MTGDSPKIKTAFIGTRLSCSPIIFRLMGMNEHFAVYPTLDGKFEIRVRADLNRWPIGEEAWVVSNAGLADNPDEPERPPWED